MKIALPQTAVKRSRWLSLGLVLVLAPSCVPQHQDEIQQLRAEVATLSAQVEALKAAKDTVPSSTAAQVAEAAPSSAPSAAAPAPAAPPPPWDEQIAEFKSEEKDKKWARLRQAPLLREATVHIKGSGASLQSVSCKTTACLVIIDVPQKPRRPYEPMANPWAEVQMTTHTKPIYSGRTRWSYLLERHDKDYEKFGDERIDPLELASEKPEAKGPTTVATSKPEKVEVAATEEKPAPEAKVGKKAAPKPAKPAAATTPAKPAAKPATKPAKPAAKPAKPTAKPIKPAVAQSPTKPLPKTQTAKAAPPVEVESTPAKAPDTKKAAPPATPEAAPKSDKAPTPSPAPAPSAGG